MAYILFNAIFYSVEMLLIHRYFRYSFRNYMGFNTNDNINSIIA